MISRRSILRGLIAAPIVCTPGLLMPIKAMPKPRMVQISGITMAEGTYQRYSGYDWYNIKGSDVLSDFVLISIA